MGYTHYWNQRPDREYKPSPETIQTFVKDAKKVIRKYRSILCYESDSQKTAPICTDNLVRFNGRGSDGHETFMFSIDLLYADSCKTEHKPYDAAVVAMLRLIIKHFGYWVIVHSDGDGEQPKTPSNPKGLLFINNNEF